MPKIAQEAFNTLFNNARTFQKYLNKPVEKSVLKDIYETFKWGPTAYNCTPMRVVYVTTPEAKAKLIPTLMPGNVPKTESAPVTAIVAYDPDYTKYLPRLAPYMVDYVKQNPDVVGPDAVHNAWLQCGYFILATRAHGLDCSPMAGFDPKKVDETFFQGKSWKSIVVMNMGYGDSKDNFPRADRLTIDEAVEFK